jgi:hypothetical protein
VTEETIVGAPLDNAELREQSADGFLYAHRRLNGNSAKLLEINSLLAALVDALVEEGVVSRETIEERKGPIFSRMGIEFLKEGMGVVLQDPEQDKYAFTAAPAIDCENRVHLCHAACCRLPFALSRQDLNEGVVQWDFGRPYMVEQDKDRYCAHLDRCSKGCTIYEKRPVPCRGFDCRDNRDIWLDFDARIPNPIVERIDWLDIISAADQAATAS